MAESGFQITSKPEAERLLTVAREQHLEGIVGKQGESRYEPGRRSRAWIKYRLNREQEFVIGGFTLQALTGWTPPSSATTAERI